MNVAIYEFGSFRLDLHERVLLRDGVIVPVQRKAFETLALLVQQHGHVVAKDEFWRTIWAESYVEEGSLTVNISILRKVLGDDQNGQRFIETVPRRGYRFVAPVRVIAMPARALADAAVPAPFPVLSATVPVPPTALPVPRRLSLRRWLLLTGVVVGLVVALVYWRWPIAPRTIAVLPFANQKPDVETNFLGYALANVIAAKLSSVHTPQLLPLSTVYRPTNQTPDPQLASGQLNVDLLLHGTYLREDGKLRITAILSEIPSRHVVWQETFDLADEKLMQLQEDVARQICTALQLTLSDEQQKLMALDVSRDPVAYEYYLRGIAWYAQERLQDAIPLLEKSVALDKSFARAWEYLGSSYAVQASTHFGGQADIEKAQQAFAEAIRLNPREPRPRLFQADLLIETNRVEQALPVLQEVLLREPQQALAAWELSYAYRYGGLLPESIVWGERALTSDPSFKLTNAVFISYLYTGQYQKFLDSLATVNDTAYVLFYRGLAYYYLQQPDAARVAFDRAYALDAELLQARIGKALSAGLSGDTAQGIALLTQCEQEVIRHGVTDAEGIYKIGQGYALLGDQPSALRALRRSIEGGFFCYPYLKDDPLLASLRAVPEYQQLLEVAQRRHESFKTKWAGKL